MSTQTQASRSPFGENEGVAAVLQSVLTAFASDVSRDNRKSSNVLIAGGVGNGALDQAAAELFDPSSSTFSGTGSLITARWGHTATLLNNGRVLVTGGVNSGSVTASAELYQ